MKVHGLVALASAVPYAIAASGGFNVLSYNIAGIPENFHDNGIAGGKSNATKRIGQEFAAGPYGKYATRLNDDSQYANDACRLTQL